jgi:hypothetical protein
VEAENGFGKTTLSDAIEFWSTGDIRAYHREGYCLDAVVNVDSQLAVVTAEVTGLPTLRRSLKGTTAADLEPAGPAALDQPALPPVPMLRHSTMADFMRMTAGDKKKAVLDLLGLAPLTAFRDTLKTACNTVKGRREDAERSEREELAALRQHVGERDPLVVAEDLRQRAGLGRAVNSLDDLLGLEVDASHIPDEPDRIGALDELARALESLGGDPSAEWNAAVADQAVRTSEALSALIESGQRVLPNWQEATCPLCLRPSDTEELSKQLGERAAHLERSQADFRKQLGRLGEYTAQLSRVAAALAVVEERAPAGGCPEGGRVTEIREGLTGQVTALKEARSTTSPCSPAPRPELDDLLRRLRNAAEVAKRSTKSQALIDLARLRDQAERLAQATRRAERLKLVASSATRLLRIAEQQIKEAVETALGDVAELAARFYGELMVGAPYSDVKLQYLSKRSGGVEFSLVFDGRHSITPPQRIMSESQLNALGLALFLAQLKVEDQPWRAMVLDDVVNAFDAPHRQGLIRLLADEFSDWQVILLTHDPSFAAIARKTVSGWRWQKIVSWTPTGGPVFGSAEPVKRLKERLDAGESADGLGGDARRALEQALAVPVEKLGYEMRYDPQYRHTGYEFLRALRKGLDRNNPELAKDPIFRRMESANYMASLGAHYRPDIPPVTRDDLYYLVADLERLAEVFCCDTCGRPAWDAEVKGKHQCRCSALAA